MRKKQSQSSIRSKSNSQMYSQKYQELSSSMTPTPSHKLQSSSSSQSNQSSQYSEDHQYKNKKRAKRNKINKVQQQNSNSKSNKISRQSIETKNKKEQLKNKKIQQFKGFVKVSKNDSFESSKNQEKTGTFGLNQPQSDYIQTQLLRKGYSLQLLDSKQQVYKSRIKAGQTTLQRFYPGDKLYKNYKYMPRPKFYSEGYHIAVKIIQELKEMNNIHQFFKTKFHELKKDKGVAMKYIDYQKIILTREPLDLETLKQIIQNPANDNIFNLEDFVLTVYRIITNSLIIHQHLNDNQTIRNTQQFQKQFFKSLIKHILPDHNQYQKSQIKTYSFKKQKPKTALLRNQVKLEQQEQQNKGEQFVKAMELNDPHNIYRIKVLNQFLKKNCLNNQDLVHEYKSSLIIIIQRYTDSIILLQEMREQPNTTLNRIDQQSSSAIIEQRSPTFSKKSQTISRKSSVNSSSKGEKVFLQVKPKIIQLALFDQLRELVKRHYDTNKNKKRNGNRDIEEQIRRQLYPHQDSQDFQLDDDTSS